MLVCPDDHQPFKTIPAGVSRSSGRPYPAFKVCSVDGCKRREEDGIEIEKFDTPAKHVLDEAPTAAETVMTKKDWEAKEEREAKRFEAKQQRDLRNQLATAALRELINHTEGKLNHQKTLDNLYFWAWNGFWPDSETALRKDVDELLGE